MALEQSLSPRKTSKDVEGADVTHQFEAISWIFPGVQFAPPPFKTSSVTPLLRSYSAVNVLTISQEGCKYCILTIILPLNGAVSGNLSLKLVMLPLVVFTPLRSNLRPPALRE